MKLALLQQILSRSATLIGSSAIVLMIERMWHGPSPDQTAVSLTPGEPAAYDSRRPIPRMIARSQPMQDVVDIQVKPLAPHCGAEIVGVDLSRDLSPRQVEAIKQAWLDHLVIVIRNQTINQEQQLRFAAHFGELGQRKKAPSALASRTEGTLQTDNRILLVSNIKEDGQPVGAFGDGEMWFHIDSGYAQKPYNYTFLYALELPKTGGNTLFSNMYQAYDALPSKLKIRLAGKKALHIHEYERSKRVELKKDLSGSPHFFHPVFATHPETLRKSLFVDRLMTRRIEGLQPAESEEILEHLYEIGERPEFIYEHEWRLGDVVAWDNRCSIHARTWFDPAERRLLRRCAIEGAPIYE
jgi:alpha-ketoglutarate-dependent taurine dioxygenase